MKCPSTLAIMQDGMVPRQWWRITRPYKYLHEHGCTVGYGYAEDLHDLPIHEGVQLIVFPAAAPAREHWQGLVSWIVTQKRQHGRKFIYDIDDDVFTNDWTDWMVESGVGGLKTRGELEDMRELRTHLMTMCDGVTVSTPTLAETVATLTDRPIWIVPNALDLPAFKASLDKGRRSRRNDPVIGWAGGIRREADLVPMLRAWGQIARKYPRVSFRMAGWAPKELHRYVPEDRVALWPWMEMNEYGRAMQVDIGCCPVPRTRFDDHRSPIKAMEYAAAGAAVIGAPSVYYQFVGAWPRGEIAYTMGERAETTDEWIDALETYITRPDVRRGHRYWLQRYVTRWHTLRTGARKWVDAYQGIWEGRMQSWQQQRNAKQRSRTEAESSSLPLTLYVSSGTQTIPSTPVSIRQAQGTA